MTGYRMCHHANHRVAILPDGSRRAACPDCPAEVTVSAHFRGEPVLWPWLLRDDDPDDQFGPEPPLTAAEYARLPEWLQRQLDRQLALIRRQEARP